MLLRFLQARKDPARPLTPTTCPRPGALEDRRSVSPTLLRGKTAGSEKEGSLEGGGAKACSSRGGGGGRGRGRREG